MVAWHFHGMDVGRSLHAALPGGTATNVSFVVGISATSALLPHPNYSEILGVARPP